MSHILYRVPKLIFFSGQGGGAYLKGGRLLQILSLRRGANLKRDTYLKLGAYLSIYRSCSRLEPKIPQNKEPNKKCERKFNKNTFLFMLRQRNLFKVAQ